jgi:adenosylcobinamide kinase/adenosylcobinamide-phosphate guanylyltransferase
MRDRIARHAADRPSHWRTIEEPLDIASAIASADGAAVIVVDCLTILLTNHLLAQGDGLDAGDEERTLRAVQGLLGAARKVSGDVIVVANEVGLGIVPEYPLARVFRDIAGRANQQVAAAADRVIFMAAGLPMRIKG